MRETAPVGVPPALEATWMLAFTGWPWVSVSGLVGGEVESASVVVVGAKLAEDH
jgi:hypothetical protein